MNQLDSIEVEFQPLAQARKLVFNDVMSNGDHNPIAKTRALRKRQDHMTIENLQIVIRRKRFAAYCHCQLQSQSCKSSFDPITFVDLPSDQLGSKIF